MLPISFLSDYGHRDECVGVCHGVIERIAPGAIVIDVTHDLPRHATCGTAALVAARTRCRTFPPGVHLAVVDPGVGSRRAAVALRVPRRDAARRPGQRPAVARGAGVPEGSTSAVDIERDARFAWIRSRPPFTAGTCSLRSRPTSRSALRWRMPAIPSITETLVRLQASAPEVDAGTLRAQVASVDRFGNLQLQARAQDMERAGLPLGACVERGRSIRGDARQHVHRRGGGRDGRVRGLLRVDRRGGERRQRSRRAGPCGRRLAAQRCRHALAEATARNGPARRPAGSPGRHGVDQRPRAGAGARGSAARDGGGGRAADRGPRQTGPHVVGTRGPGADAVRARATPAALRSSCCRWQSRSPSRGM